MPKLVAMLRVKDGKLFIDDWLANIAPLVDEIVAVDNGSTDGTFEALSQHPAVVSVDRVFGFDEGRDKNLLYTRARERNPDWLLWLDVDEIFESAVNRERLNRIMETKHFTRIFFRRFHFIDDWHFNLSPFWLRATAHPDRVLWRDAPTGNFENLPFNNGLVRGIRGPARISHMRLKHMGYAHRDEVEKKIRIYRLVDPSMERTYQRMKFNGAIPVQWHENNDAPIRVAAWNVFFDFVFVFEAAPKRLKRLLLRIAAFVRRSILRRADNI